MRWYTLVCSLHIFRGILCIVAKVENPFGSSIQVLFSIFLSSRHYHPYSVTPGITSFASQLLHHTNACKCDLTMDVSSIHALVRAFFGQMSFIRSSHFRQSTLLFEKAGVRWYNPPLNLLSIATRLNPRFVQSKLPPQQTYSTPTADCGYVTAREAFSENYRYDLHLTNFTQLRTSYLSEIIYETGKIICMGKYTCS